MILDTKGSSFSQFVEQIEEEDLSKGSSDRRAEDWSWGEERSGSKVERCDCKELGDTFPADTSLARREGCMELGTPLRIGQISTDIAN